MWKLMQFLGFYGDDDDYDDDESEGYTEEQPKPVKKQKQAKRRADNQGAGSSYPAAATRLVLFRGVPSDSVKLKLREAFKDGTMLLLDLRGLDAREMEEEGRPFTTFMQGVAFARGGRMDPIGPEQYLVSPTEGMFQEWIEEGPQDDGTFDRQGR